MKQCVTISVALFTLCAAAHAQQPAPNQPIDLPEFIVTGTERIEVPSSAKQPPSKPPSMKAQLLDSLNPTEKHPLPKLPARALPNPRLQYTMWPGFIEAGIGNYITPALIAGYSLKAGGYRLDLVGKAEAALDAWTPNAEYFKASADVLSTYTAPSEFLVFGGSTTEVDLGYNTRRYKLYALSTAPVRTTSRMRAAVAVKGAVEGFNYDGGASFASTTLNTDSAEGRLTYSDVSDNMLRGHLLLEQKWEHYDVGARLDLRLPTFSGNAYPFIEGLAFARFSSDVVRISAGAGAQTSTSTLDVSRFGVLLVGELDLFLGRALTLQANVRSGLRPITFSDLLEENQYTSSTIILDAAYDVFDLRGTIVLRPSLPLAATVGLRLRQTERHPVWVGDSSGTFAPSYQTVTMFQIPADVRWMITARDVLTADITFTTARVDSVSQPYVPGIRSSIAYERAWTTSIRSVVAAVYIGDRYSDLANASTISGYVDVRLRAEVDFTSTLSAHVRAENIFGSTIVLWRGYAERSSFFSGGITWKF